MEKREGQQHPADRGGCGVEHPSQPESVRVPCHGADPEVVPHMRVARGKKGRLSYPVSGV